MSDTIKEKLWRKHIYDSELTNTPKEWVSLYDDFSNAFDEIEQAVREGIEEEIFKGTHPFSAEMILSAIRTAPPEEKV